MKAYLTRLHCHQWADCHWVGDTCSCRCWRCRLAQYAQAVVDWVGGPTEGTRMP